jgi:putative redox protein
MQYSLRNPVHVSIGNKKYRCTIQGRKGEFIVDVPETSGGNDTGPDPLYTVAFITGRLLCFENGWRVDRDLWYVNLPAVRVER